MSLGKVGSFFRENFDVKGKDQKALKYLKVRWEEEAYEYVWRKKG